MKPNLLRLVGPVLLALMTVSGCSSLEHQLRSASRDKGTTQARVTLPDLPADCRKKEPHAELKVGAEVRSILKRERAALDRQNARTSRCADNYDNIRERLK